MLNNTQKSFRSTFFKLLFENLLNVFSHFFVPLSKVLSNTNLCFKVQLKYSNFIDYESATSKYEILIELRKYSQLITLTRYNPDVLFLTIEDYRTLTYVFSNKNIIKYIFLNTYY